MDRKRVLEKLNGLEIQGQSAVYKLGKELGRGGNGIAMQCKSSSSPDLLVAKFYIPPDNRDLDDRALSRFRNEIGILKRIRHPYIVRWLDASTVSLGSYTIPFYIMPFAKTTLRFRIKRSDDPINLESSFRIFARIASGVSFLHHNGIIHRDIKPENILIDKFGNPLVADLGIAHANSDFASIALNTMDSEKLLNKDYYAPEQRFGKSTEVDHRADIYSLGLILYEIISAIPPVRVSTPPLSALSPALAPMDSIWRKMTDWEPKNRYQSIDDAMEDVWLAAGSILHGLRSGQPVEIADLDQMGKLFKSNNELQRQQGADIAARLGKAALPELHSLLGHSRRDVRDNAALALGRIASPDSIPYLVSGMYGNSTKASTFRPTCDSASTALSQYPEDERIKAVGLINKPIRINQIIELLSGVDIDISFDLIATMHSKGLFLFDWTESVLSILAEIDEERAWPAIEKLILSKEHFQIRGVIPKLGDQRRAQALKLWASVGTDYSWHFDNQIKFLNELAAPKNIKQEIGLVIQDKIFAFKGKYDQRNDALETLERIIAE